MSSKKHYTNSKIIYKITFPVRIKHDPLRHKHMHVWESEGMNRKTLTSSQICALPHKIPFLINAFLPPFYIFKIPLYYNSISAVCKQQWMTSWTASSVS
jgi:hypothetical protein